MNEELEQQILACRVEPSLRSSLDSVSPVFSYELFTLAARTKLLDFFMFVVLPLAVVLCIIVDLLDVRTGILVLCALLVLLILYAKADRRKMKLALSKKMVRMGELRLLANNVAARLLVDCLRHSRPFALYLRTFDEARETGVPAGGGRVFYEFSRKRDIEEALTSYVSNYMPVIGLENILDPKPLTSRDCLKLRVPQERWEDLLRPLIAAAHITVVRVRTLGQGLSFELGLIRELGLCEHTVLIFDDALPLKEPRRPILVLGEDPTSATFISDKDIGAQAPFDAVREWRSKDLPYNGKEKLSESFPRSVSAQEFVGEIAKREEIFADLLHEPVSQSVAIAGGDWFALPSELPWPAPIDVRSPIEADEYDTIIRGLAEFGSARILEQALLSLDRNPLLWTDRTDILCLATIEYLTSEGDHQRARKFAEALLLLRRFRAMGELGPLFSKFSRV